MKHPAMRTVAAVALGLAMVLALTWLLGQVMTSAAAASGSSESERDAPLSLHQTSDIITVCLEGTCNYSDVQAAVDAAGDGALIKVAQGLYTGVSARAGVTQVVYISKAVTLQGGYTMTNWVTPYPLTQPTTLDAQGQGRVVYITGDISPTIEGLRITGGNAAGFGGDREDGAVFDVGGGVYAITATASISNNWIFSNTAEFAGGLWLYGSSATLSGNIVSTNIATGCGGMALYFSAATVSANTISSNTVNGGSGGGGLCLVSSTNTLIANIISDNRCGAGGGGVFVREGRDTLNGNIVSRNTARYDGGGLTLVDSEATLIANVVSGNTVHGSDEMLGNKGGGIAIFRGSGVFANNAIVGNRADMGSGVYIGGASSQLLHNTIAYDGLATADEGVYVTANGYDHGVVVLTNTILVSHTIGITVTAGNTVTLNGVLWYGNAANTGGVGTITITHAITGDPAFAADGYHLVLSSAAIDAGVDAGVTTDIDGVPRPIGPAPDLGADEFPVPVRRVYLPFILRVLP